MPCFCSFSETDTWVALRFRWSHQLLGDESVTSVELGVGCASI